MPERTLSSALLFFFFSGAVPAGDVIHWLPSKRSEKRSSALYAVIALYNAA